MKALIVEDEELTLLFLKKALEEYFNFQEVVLAKDGREAWDLCSEDNNFRFFVIDLILPEMDGIKLSRRILEKNGASARILAISSECDDFTVKEVGKTGILGFMDKPNMTESLLYQAAQRVLDGKVYYSESVRGLLNQLGEDSEAYYKVLSERELEVLRLIGHGMNRDQVSEALGISPFTVRRHRVNISAKLNCKTEAQLMQYALDKGIVKYKGGLGWT